MLEATETSNAVVAADISAFLFLHMITRGLIIQTAWSPAVRNIRRWKAARPFLPYPAFLLVFPQLGVLSQVPAGNVFRGSRAQIGAWGCHPCVVRIRAHSAQQAQRADLIWLVRGDLLHDMNIACSLGQIMVPPDLRADVSGCLTGFKLGRAVVALPLTHEFSLKSAVMTGEQRHNTHF